MLSRTVGLTDTAHSYCMRGSKLFLLEYRANCFCLTKVTEIQDYVMNFAIQELQGHQTPCKQTQAHCPQLGLGELSYSSTSRQQTGLLAHFWQAMGGYSHPLENTLFHWRKCRMKSVCGYDDCSRTNQSRRRSGSTNQIPVICVLFVDGVRPRKYVKQRQVLAAVVNKYAFIFLFHTFIFFTFKQLRVPF